MIFSVSASPYLQVHGFSVDSINNLVRELIDIGIGGIKVNYGDPERGFTSTASAINLIERAQNAGLRICAHAPATDISSTDPAIRKQAISTVRRAMTNLGTSLPGMVFTVHPEDYAPQRQHGDDLTRVDCCQRSLEILTATASDLGARLALENMRWRPDAPNRTGMYVDQLSEIVADLDPLLVGLCFDTGHANISERSDIAGAFERNASRIIHIHWHDNVGSEDLHLAPGQGNIDFKTLFHTVTKAQYDGMVELEVPVPENDDPLSFYQQYYQYFMQVIGLN